MMGISLTEFDQEEYDRNRWSEAYSDGIRDNRISNAKAFLMKGVEPTIIAFGTGLSLDEVMQLKAAL